MNEYLKSYNMTIHTVGPVFIGSGRDYSKREYVLLQNRGKVYIPNQEYMYYELKRRHLETDFTNYMLSDDRENLQQFFFRNRIAESEYLKWMEYSLDCGDYLRSKGQLQICAFMKDAYGQPFVPGSSIKGMLRTVLLAHKGNDDGSFIKDIPEQAKLSNDKRQYYLRRAASDLEQKVFHTLSRMDSKGNTVAPKDAVNDCLSGLIVSDSMPLSTDDLTLCQMIEEHTDGSEHIINTLRECIKPGTDIHFTISIDTAISDYSIEDIMAAVKSFSHEYSDCFGKYFARFEKSFDNTVWLGGGSGFASKTVLYPLLGHESGMKTAIEVFEHTLPEKIREQHKHHLDTNDRISPHILKVTQFNRKRYQMGTCELYYQEI